MAWFGRLDRATCGWKSTVVLVVFPLIVLITIVMQHRQVIDLRRTPVISKGIKLMRQNAFIESLSAPATERNLVEVLTNGPLLDRIRQFNDFLVARRKNTYVPELSKNWTSPAGLCKIINGGEDDFIGQLLDSAREIEVVVLSWLRTGRDLNGGDKPRWSSLEDTQNLLLQVYHEWTADDVLCTWVETRGTINMRYDSIFNRTCDRRINDTAEKRSIAPVFLNAKALNPTTYWPNNGDLLPAHFFTDTPPYVTYMFVHRNAVVTDLSDVYSGNHKLVQFACSGDFSRRLPNNGKVDQIPLYDEVFAIGQYWGKSVYHRMTEVAPRLAAHVDFLKANPSIRILANERSDGRLGEILRIIGLDPSRLVTGTVRAKIAYQPRSTCCTFTNVVEAQLLSNIYRTYIRTNFPSQPRNRLILIRRSGSRRFTEQEAIERFVAKAAEDYGLNYTLFRDNPTPSFNDTMQLFHSAVIVVGASGAGLSNVLFSPPGTYVLEGVCNLPHVNFCHQRLSHILGHHWHGTPSRGGCEGVVDVDAAKINGKLRQFLQLWKSERP